MTVSLLSKAPELHSIRLKVSDVAVSCDPPTSKIPLQLTGTLYIDEQRLVFASADSSLVFALDYPSIVIHAVSRDGDPARHHLYCQLDGPFPGTARSQRPDDDDGNASDASDADDTNDAEEFSELRFCPSDNQILDEMFSAMSDCAALNPDYTDEQDMESDVEVDKYDRNERREDGGCHSDSYSDNDNDNNVHTISSFDPSDFITSAEQIDQLTPAGKIIFKHLESVITLPEGWDPSTDKYTGNTSE
ncbi:hypothetical protein GGI07_004559 [Coemansia sp. Benny D115]|nr:hypothetical protein GGI07_004559 [Coemansia sp. Benny D115]